MEMEFYVNMDMDVYVYVCVCDDSRDLEGGRVFDRVFFLGTLKIVRQFLFLFSGNARILFKTTAMERFFTPL